MEETSETLFVGVKGHVVAFDKRDGTELWKTQLVTSGLALGGGGFVTVFVEGERIYAHAYGELFCLDAQTGEQLWSDELVGLGYGIATLAAVGASSPPPAALAEERRRRAAAAGGASRGGSLP